MSKFENFSSLVDRAMTTGRAHMRPAVTKELLHYDILFALDNDGLLDKLTFQGGTSLRLCYGAPRFSEDLDFAGGRLFTNHELEPIKACLEKFISQKYGLEISVKEPKDIRSEIQHKEIKVDVWQIAIVTAPERKDLPKQKIKIEIANVPAYSRIPQALYRNYEFLPDGYSDTLIMTESLNEIMADKLIAFVSCQRYIRYRDLWDLRWLKQQGAQIQAEYLLNKIRDYKEKDYPHKLQKTLDRLEEIIRSKIFRDEISRFLPMEVLERTLQKDRFLEFLINETRKMFLEVRQILEP